MMGERASRKQLLRVHDAKVRTVRHEMRDCLPYRLGALLLLARRPRNWRRIPIALRELVRSRRLDISPEEVIRYARSDILRKWLSRIPPSDVFLAVSRIAHEGGWPLAIEFAKRHARPGYGSAVELLSANLDPNDEAAWLAGVNAYLRSFGLSPVRLVGAQGPKIARLQVEDIEAIEDGDLISVIMPAFNAAGTIRHAANSILAQSWRNLELIIVDDCSTDETWEIVQEIASADDRVKLLRNVVNVGPYVSKNLAVRAARGKYITGHDADDWAHPERLENDLAVILESEGRVSAVLSAMLRMDEIGEFARFSGIGPSSEDGVSRTAAISVLIETEVFKNALGSWDSVRFSADGELIGRARAVLGERFQVVHQIGMICLDLPTSLSNDPRYGVSNLDGKSKTRREYANAYQGWHSKIKSADATMPFPPSKRLFMAPVAMVVPQDAIQENICAHHAQIESATNISE